MLAYYHRPDCPGVPTDGVPQGSCISSNICAIVLIARCEKRKREREKKRQHADLVERISCNVSIERVVYAS